MLSTHDQMLGGPSGQSYLGCRFPADSGYAQAITARPAKIGERLAGEGVLGRFALDFVVVRDADGAWTPYAIELNLRKGGTTHPFLTLQFLTDGAYDPATALFTAPSGREKHLVATDHLEDELLRGLTIDDLFDIVVRHRLHFDQARQTGVVFHMMSCAHRARPLGLTAVGDSPAEADALFRRAERMILEEAGPAPEPPLPEVTGRLTAAGGARRIRALAARPGRGSAERACRPGGLGRAGLFGSAAPLAGALQADRVARLEAARRAQVRTPARALEAARVAGGARVEPQPGDHGVRVAGVRVDGDPVARARLAPAHERARVQRAVEQVAAVEGERDGPRAVVAAVGEAAAWPPP